jgi:hypothetical protein
MHLAISDAMTLPIHGVSVIKKGDEMGGRKEWVEWKGGRERRKEGRKGREKEKEGKRGVNRNHTHQQEKYQQHKSILAKRQQLVRKIQSARKCEEGRPSRRANVSNDSLPPFVPHSCRLPGADFSAGTVSWTYRGLGAVSGVVVVVRGRIGLAISGWWLDALD